MPGKKSDSHTVELRRKTVFKLRMMGQLIPKIAESLKVSVDTIYDDLIWLRKEAKNFVSDFDEKIDIGFFLKKMQELEEMYMREYIRAGSIQCPDCRGTGKLLRNKIEINCDMCQGKGTYEDTKIKIVVINKIQELNIDVAKIKTEIGLWPQQVKLPDDKSFETLIVESRKDRKLLSEPIETITEKKIKVARIEKKEEKESMIAKKIKEIKNKGGNNK